MFLAASDCLDQGEGVRVAEGLHPGDQMSRPRAASCGVIEEQHRALHSAQRQRRAVGKAYRPIVWRRLGVFPYTAVS